MTLLASSRANSDEAEILTEVGATQRSSIRLSRHQRMCITALAIKYMASDSTNLFHAR